MGHARRLLCFTTSGASSAILSHQTLRLGERSPKGSEGLSVLVNQNILDRIDCRSHIWQSARKPASPIVIRGGRKSKYWQSVASSAGGDGAEPQRSHLRLKSSIDAGGQLQSGGMSLRSARFSKSFILRTNMGSWLWTIEW